MQIREEVVKRGWLTREKLVASCSAHEIISHLGLFSRVYNAFGGSKLAIIAAFPHWKLEPHELNKIKK
jgi:hypothetical protein